MRKVTSLLFVLLNCCAINALLAQYNTLMIPDTLSGTTFNLALKDTLRLYLKVCRNFIYFTYIKIISFRNS